jgi:hypothetical protein
LEERKKALGYAGNDFVMPNSGVSRTPEKRALLKQLADMAGRVPGCGVGAEQGRGADR